VPARATRRNSPAERKLRKELESLRAQLLEAQRLASVGTVAAMVVHEFNNILMPIQNFAARALDADEATRQQAARRVQEAAARADAICRALLGLAGPAGRVRKTVGVGQLVRETLAAMGRDPAKDGIRGC